MRTKAIQLMGIFFLWTGMIFAQDIPQSQMPSEVVNTFKTEFPKARDVEWELKGEEYKVEFEIGSFSDYDAWFSSSGKLLRYKQELSKRDLPTTIKDEIKKRYPDYYIDDVDKMVENGVETYKVEIERGKEEIDLIFSAEGKLLN